MTHCFKLQSTLEYTIFCLVAISVLNDIFTMITNNGLVQWSAKVRGPKFSLELILLEGL